MPHALPTRRPDARAATFWLAAGLALLAAPGCENSLTRRFAWPDPREGVRAEKSTTSVNGDARPRPAPARPLEPTLELPDLQETPVSAHTPGRSPGRVSLASGTPNLDAALARANSVEGAADDTPVELPQAEAPKPTLPKAEPPAVDPPATPPAATSPMPPAPLELPIETQGVPALAPKSADEGPPPVMPAVKVDAAFTPAGLTPPDSEAPVAVATPPIEPKPEDSPAESWRSGLERLKTLAKGPAPTSDDEALWPLRARVLDWLGGDALKPEQAAAWTTVLAALAASSTPGGREDGSYVDTLNDAVDTLESLVPLHASEVLLARKVHGFGHVDSLDPNSLRPGQTLIVYCEMAGLHWAKTADGVRSRLASRVEVVKRGESRPVWSQDLGTAEDACRRRRRDYYVNYKLALPKSLPAGPYDLRLTQTDLVGEHTTSATVSFAILP